MRSIVIVEDHPLMRRGLEAYFTGTGRWQVLGSVPGLGEAQALFSTSGVSADILLLDIQLESSWGLDLLPWLRGQEKRGKEGATGQKNPFKAPPVLVYSAFVDYARVNAAFSMGVRGYVSKSRNEAELEAALEAVLRGEIYCDQAVERELAVVSDALSLLTRREGEILTLVKEGLSNKAIAERLGITRRTVENILSCVYDKTGIPSRLELQKL
jgi:NarL family two-component system response regulator LiaR